MAYANMVSVCHQGRGASSGRPTLIHYVRLFRSPSEIERYCAEFVRFYNTARPHSSYSVLTPDEVHAGRHTPARAVGRVAYFDGQLRWYLDSIPSTDHAALRLATFRQVRGSALRLRASRGHYTHLRLHLFWHDLRVVQMKRPYHISV